MLMNKQQKIHGGKTRLILNNDNNTTEIQGSNYTAKNTWR